MVHDGKSLKGRANDAIAAACLYIACRSSPLPLLLPNAIAIVYCHCHCHCHCNCHCHGNGNRGDPDEGGGDEGDGDESDEDECDGNCDNLLAIESLFIVHHHDVSIAFKSSYPRSVCSCLYIFCRIL